MTARTGEEEGSSASEAGGDACCEKLVRLLEDPDAPLDVDWRVREWSLYVFPIADPDRPDWRDGLVRQGLVHCPFCGLPFPDSVRVEYFQHLRAMGIDDPWLQRDEVPVEYQSDTWWREAGL